MWLSFCGGQASGLAEGLLLQPNQMRSSSSSSSCDISGTLLF